MSLPTINLLKRSSRLPPVVLQWEKHLGRLTIYLWIFFLLSGILIGTSYLILRGRYNKLLASKISLTTEISNQSEKEALFLLVKARLNLISKIREASWSLDKLLAALTSFAPASTLRSLDGDEEKEINVVYQSGDLGEIAAIIQGLVVLSQERQIRNPELKSLTIAADEQIKLTVAFTPIL